MAHTGLALDSSFQSVAVASLHSSANHIANYTKKISHPNRPDVDITIHDHHDYKVYSTFDPIKGYVDITAPHDAPFDQVSITLEGISKTYVENLTPSAHRSKMTAVHKFLRLVMPIAESQYPQPRLAVGGETYRFKFNFAIPEHLLPRSCTHPCADHVHHAHLQVPPSLGDKDVSGGDDMAPDMSKIGYYIRVRVLKDEPRDNVLAEGSRKICVRPAVPEAPPMSLAKDDVDYIMTKTASLKKGLFSGKLGRITVSAAQPSAIILPSPSSTDASATQMATVNLRFIPHDASSTPPRLGGLTSKIRAVTCFAARPAHTFPSRFRLVSQFEITKGVYTTTVPLASRCVESVAWEKQLPQRGMTRRRSDSSTDSSASDLSDCKLSPSDGNLDLPSYTASVLVPINLPANKVWIPSFHTCITSRIYLIELSLSIHTPGAGIPSTTCVLKLPIQLAANANQTSRTSLTPAEAAAELASANTFLTPRIIEPPAEELIGGSMLIGSARSDLPPSYEVFASQIAQTTQSEQSVRAVVDPGRG
jgi:hypothetical protein